MRFLTSVFSVTFHVDPDTAEQLGCSAEELAATTASGAFAQCGIDQEGGLSFEDFQAWYSHSTFAASSEDGMLYDYKGEGEGK